MEYHGKCTPVFDFKSVNLRSFTLSVDEDVFRNQLINASDFSGLEELDLSVRNATKGITIQNFPQLKDLTLYCDSQIVLSDLNALESFTVHTISDMKIHNCENIKKISLRNMQGTEYIDFSGFKKLDSLDCQKGSVGGFRLFSPYTKVSVSECDAYIDYCDNTQFFAPRDIPDTDMVPADINYQPIIVSGVTECDCTGKTGYRIDLDGDGVEELLYSDETGFYINGVNQGFARHNYVYDDKIWNRFYLVDADESDGKINVILNAESLDYLRAVYYGDSDLYDDLTVEYGSFGQYLATYENTLTLIGYAESRSMHDKAAKTALFSGAVYDGKKGIFFQSAEYDACNFCGIRNGFAVQNTREIELIIAEDGMVEVPDTFLSELQNEK